VNALIRGSAPEAGGLEEAQWVIVAAAPGRSVRFAASHEMEGAPEGAWVEARALSHREALERESIGTYEAYELADNGCVLSVVRRQDLWAMAEYDYTHSLTDFCLPERLANGEVSWRRLGDGTVEQNLSLLEAMPPCLAEWVQSCVDRVNLRTTAGQTGLAQAKKS